MNSDDAASTLIELASGDKKSFPKKQAERILDLQKRTGLVDFSEPDEPDASGVTAEATDPTSPNADNGSTGDSVNSEASKRGGTKKGV